MEGTVTENGRAANAFVLTLFLSPTIFFSWRQCKHIKNVDQAAFPHPRSESEFFC
jgi:hypothetical protein